MFIRKLAIVTLAATLTAAPAFAAQPDARTRSVRYADLNLSTPAGLATLRHRIAGAAETVCGSYAGTVGLEETMEIQKCRANVERQAERRIAELVSANVRLASSR